MIEVIAKLLLIGILLTILWQDDKERLVLWLLFPALGLVAFWIQFQQLGLWQALVNTLFCLSFVSIILFCGYMYSVIVGKSFVNGSIGTGDILLFVFISCAFAPIAFIILFTAALLFSLFLHLYRSGSPAVSTVPLAGYIALFFAVVYTVSFFIQPKHLYSY